MPRALAIDRRPWGRAVLAASVSVLTTCGPAKPPPDFAPDPSIVDAIESIRIHAPDRACPGQEVPATYEAVLEGGFRLPFVNVYDDKRPPSLHIAFLSREGAHATPLDETENGHRIEFAPGQPSSRLRLLSRRCLRGFAFRSSIFRANHRELAAAYTAPAARGAHVFPRKSPRGDQRT